MKESLKILLKTVFISSLIFYSHNLLAQENNDTIVKMVNNHLLITINENGLLNKPQGVEIKPTSISGDIYWYKVLFGRRSILSFNIGYGISTFSYKTNSILQQDSLNKTFFNTTILDTNDYLINKYTSVFFDVPVEFRIRTRPTLIKNRSFVFTVGFKAGYMISDYHKYLGEDYRGILPDEQIKFKEYYQKNALKYRYGLYTRVSYGEFYLYGYYSLTAVFNDNGPAVIPFSVGFGMNIYTSKVY